MFSFLLDISAKYVVDKLIHCFAALLCEWSGTLRSSSLTFLFIYLKGRKIWTPQNYHNIHPNCISYSWTKACTTAKRINEAILHQKVYNFTLMTSVEAN